MFPAKSSKRGWKYENWELSRSSIITIWPAYNNNNNNNNNNETNFLAFPWNIRTILMSSLLESYPGRCLSLLCFLSKSIIFIIVFCFLFFLAFYLSLAETLFVYICSHRAALLGSRHGNFPIFNQKVLSELSLIT